ncbi:glutamate synthase large subunit [Mycolicibacterium moriokaense]|uniref:Glutamate synthase n=1 Tax=Mycolicibacterium moriokaense TaxID=39691 RepID=A0AAD1M5Z1_9MYCO|nr:glutamate synthase large subunit [Mycolicibacterium moriokaense]MCV7038624.1 glutamate synthase large subunit [Mycolicibacterium moriokaense]ORB22645.1 glutamate synthase large subunit [Mycolicibacterium moriokaense]BBX02147.1 glutamate synthase [Mycolicibacterium moriokaense]
MQYSAFPEPQGLYDPANESDSCGVAMITDIQGRRSHAIVVDGLVALEHLEHRGAAGAEPNSGDGAGILIQLPVELLREVVDFELPEPTADGASTFAAGICFLPQDSDARAAARAHVEAIAAEEGLTVLGWREVPTDPVGAEVGATALGCMPHMEQLFVTSPQQVGGIDLDRRVYPMRKRAERNGVYFPSLSSRTMVYKGMLTTIQLPQYFPDLRDERCRSAIAIVHSRFSTNTFPSWPLAHPFRFVAHNGEINTVRGNRNRMHAREAMLASSKIPGDLSRLSPICTPEASDSASFDEVLELLHLGGRSLPHAVLMMIPEAWENATAMDPAERAFWQFHASLMEPWDGPACVTFTDGTLVGAVLDRNGLRPGRWWRTLDDRIILASESGVLDVPSAQIVAKGRLQPGKMFLIDTAAGRIVSDDEIKESLAVQQPYGEWLHSGLLDLKTLPDRVRIQPNHESVVRRQIAFGYTEEDLRILLTPMAASGNEPLGSMGTDTPAAVLSQRSRLLYDYFVELFAQVTNPPLDAIREEVVTSMARVMGPEQNLLEPTAASCRQIVLRWPVLDNDELNKIVHINDDGEHGGLRTAVLKALYDVERGGEGLAEALEDLRLRACDAIAKGARTLVISDRDSDHTRAPIPSLLAVSAVHHHLVRTKERTNVALVVESGDAREVHHIAMLIGFGAAAVNPYLAFESIEDLVREGELTGIEPAAAVRNYLKALGKGVMKVMSKMGISTVASYTAAQCFEAIGIDRHVIDEYFTGTPSQLGGVGLEVLAEEVKLRHRRAYPENPTERVHRRLEVGGEYAFRREGELHLFTPEVVFLLQHSTRTGRYDIFKQYSDEVDRLCREGGTLRGLFGFKKLRPPVPLEEVESVDSIVTRFNTGAMSYGSISAEAHETMAIAMNNLGGRSNSGEGGEDTDRLYDPRRRSAVKQVASGRFGVTSDYLVNATDIQIKMAQGAKPGEGGQLPGYKVYPNIAKTRHSTPGVGLISPPPHHDIYSIEDLAQLIHDLKNANADARIHVKLVSSVGVGTVAAGVSKAHADVVLISGYDGGTGAAPLTSLKHAGIPWEIGLADTQQTLMLNGLRDRITVQCDGGMRTARDVIVAALLGAEEFGFATAPLIVSGCIMMRVCHLDTCPVGVATQNPELRARFNGKPEFVENFFRFIAEDIRRYLAELGFRSIDEAVGHAEMLDTDEGVAHWKSKGLDLTPIFAVPEGRYGERRRTRDQDHGLDEALDRTLIQLAEGALEDAHPVRLELPVRNVNRTVGTLLGSEVTRRYGAEGLPDNTIHVTLTGSAGQSIGAFLPPGITLELVGDANDYVGKGLSGGRVIVRPPDDVLFLPEDNVIAGNTLLFGATSGELYLRGRVGERFAARNSGALTVVEGVGDHACEYMTGGRVVILGKTGRNMAAGMSGGIAFVLALDPKKVNTEMVELQRLEPEDLTWLHEVIATHARFTGSTLAASVLSDWPRRSAQFTKVMPRDYQRVLEATLVAKREGRDVDTAIMEASRG